MDMEQHPLAEATYFMRFVVALLLGVAIGFEREWRQRMAGLHTTAMVCAGAAIFAMIAPLMEAKGVDPTRIAAQVVSGIGFLAGGVILRQGATVRGLTTAATLWATSAVGVLAGFGFLTQAAGAAFVIIGANVLLYPLALFIESLRRETRDVKTTYTVEVACGAESEVQVRERVVEIVSGSKLELAAIQSSSTSQTDILVQAQLSRMGRDDRAIERLATELKSVAGVSSVRWRAGVEYL
jgi:putative Mg2+ transporter-C (MgtC) family protein